MSLSCAKFLIAAEGAGNELLLPSPGGKADIHQIVEGGSALAVFFRTGFRVGFPGQTLSDLNRMRLPSMQRCPQIAKGTKCGPSSTKVDCSESTTR